MPTIQDFEEALTNAGPHDQLSATANGGVRLKGNSGRLKTWLTNQETADKRMLNDFRNALETAYGKEAADLAWNSSGLDQRLADGRPLSVQKALQAIQEAKTARILSENVKYEQIYHQREDEATQWTPSPKASQVEGSGLRLVTHDQGDFRIHNWNARNDINDKGNVLELDELVHKEVAALKDQRKTALEKGQNVEPMSDRLLYLQAKLNLTERMVSEAARPENLKEGGPSANMFLGPDMFFSPSDGPVINGVKTYGGACTEEEMKRITEGLAEISRKHPEVTLMPGTIMWGKPSATIPKIDGLPRPSDLSFNTAPVLSKGQLAHVIYKKTDGGDANWTAAGVNGPDGKAFTEPSATNQFQARLQVFPKNEVLVDKLGREAMTQVQAVLDEIETQSNPLSKGREWEDQMRTGGAGDRSLHNNFFMIEDKVVALEICRDHTNRLGMDEFIKHQSDNDPVMKKAREQQGPNGGVNLHVVLSASNAMSRSNTVCCENGVAAQNDVSGGKSQSMVITKRSGPIATQSPSPSNSPIKTTFYNKYDLEKQQAKLNVPKVEGGKIEQESQTPKKVTVKDKLFGKDVEKKGITKLSESVELSSEKQDGNSKGLGEESSSLKKTPKVGDKFKVDSLPKNKSDLDLDQSTKQSKTFTLRTSKR